MKLYWSLEHLLFFVIFLVIIWHEENKSNFRRNIIILCKNWFNIKSLNRFENVI